MAGGPGSLPLCRRISNPKPLPRARVGMRFPARSATERGLVLCAGPVSRRWGSERLRGLSPRAHPLRALQTVPVCARARRGEAGPSEPRSLERKEILLPAPGSELLFLADPNRGSWGRGSPAAGCSGAAPPLPFRLPRPGMTASCSAPLGTCGGHDACRPAPGRPAHGAQDPALLSLLKSAGARDQSRPVKCQGKWQCHCWAQMLSTPVSCLAPPSWMVADPEETACSDGPASISRPPTQLGCRSPSLEKLRDPTGLRLKRVFAVSGRWELEGWIPSVWPGSHCGPPRALPNSPRVLGCVGCPEGPPGVGRQPRRAQRTRQGRTHPPGPRTGRRLFGPWGRLTNWPPPPDIFSC